MGRRLEYTKDAGVYKLTCIVNGKVYIGKGIQINKRINRHKNCKVGDGYLQRAILKYGWDSFTIEILETIDNFDKTKDNEFLLEREAHYIRLFDSTDEHKGYNICKHSTDRTGFVMSEETKEKIRKANTGNPKLIEANLGKVLSEDQKGKISESLLGKNKSKEHSDNISKGKKGKASKLKGRVLSEERREQMRLVWERRKLNKL